MRVRLARGSTFFVDLPVYKAQKGLAEDELREEQKEPKIEKKPWWKRIFFGM